MSAEPEICLSYKNLSKSFGKVQALSDINLEVKRGEVFGFIGPDGAGKTTLIRIAMGIVKPDSGECLLFGESNLRRARIKAGYISQIFSMYMDMTVLENIHFYGALYGASKKEVMDVSERTLKRTGLWPFRDRMARNLSGGMKQKLALSAGLLHRPEVLFLDEPTTGVDPVARREFWAMLYELNKEGMTIVVSTPYMDEAELCTRKMFINNGKILDVGTTEELTERFDGRVLELEFSHRKAKSWLLECESVKDVNMFGSSYHVVVDDVDTAVGAIEKAFAERGLDAVKITEIPPGLEDIFVSFTAD
jgi:ABC-2 type transport system ATP-binding protein